jgi:ribonuclease D
MTEWIDTAEGVAEAWAHAAAAPVVAIDTESDQMHAYRPELCVLQLATEAREFVIDTLALPEGALDGLGRLLANPAVVKVMHAADNDMRLLQRQHGFRIQGLFDTQEAARFLGEPKTGLISVLERYLGVAHHKRFQQQDWRKRPLPPAAIEYAGMDVRHLIDLRRVMTDALQDRGWFTPFAEACRALEAKDYGDPAGGWGRSAFDPESFRKINGSKGLGGRGRAILRALYVWRHSRCEAENRAAIMVMEDRVLIDLARLRPQTPSALATIKGMSHRQLRHYGAAVLQVIEDAMTDAIPPARAPRAPRRWDTPADLDPTLLKRLTAWRDEEATRDNIDGALVAPRKVLERLARYQPTDLSLLARACDSDWLPWQLTRYGDRALAVIRAHRSA